MLGFIRWSEQLWMSVKSTENTMLVVETIGALLLDFGLILAGALFGEAPIICHCWWVGASGILSISPFIP